MANPERPQIQSLIEKALEFLPYQPLENQFRLLTALASYATARGPADIFILNGYAGTGKTSLMGAMVKAISYFGLPTVVLAPTGRAAKVASLFASGPASTIHKRIFRPDSMAPDAKYFLAPNLDEQTLFIVDEASLVTDNPYEGRSLLRQLLRHIYSAPGCGVIFMGDVAQLPPIGQSDSPAMNPERLKSYGFSPITFNLDVPVRQAAGSGILINADMVRRRIFSPPSGPLTLKVSPFPDIEAVSSADLADLLSSSWQRVGAEETLIVTRSNKRANNFNLAVRNLVMMAEEPLQQGDRLVVSKNDYYWLKLNRERGFIANGDIAVVKWVGRNEKMYGRYFCDVELYFPAENREIGAKIMIRSLLSEGPTLPKEELDRFYNHVLAEQEGSFTEKLKSVMEDPYYNAIQAKYAYCVTCHKAQGGQWRHVYIDMGGIAPEAMNAEFYRWLYTAMTRATERLYIINSSLPVE